MQFSQVRSYLIADKALHGFYEQFKSDFPSVHSTLYSIVSSRYFKDAVDSDLDNDGDGDDEPSIHIYCLRRAVQGCCICSEDSLKSLV